MKRMTRTNNRTTGYRETILIPDANLYGSRWSVWRRPLASRLTRKLIAPEIFPGRHASLGCNFSHTKSLTFFQWLIWKSNCSVIFQEQNLQGGCHLQLQEWRNSRLSQYWANDWPRIPTRSLSTSSVMDCCKTWDGFLRRTWTPARQFRD